MREDVITAIYEAPLADKPWASLAPLLRSVTNSNGVLLEFMRVGRKDSNFLVADADWDFQASSDQYQRIYKYQDPISYEDVSVGKIYRFEDLMDRDAYVRSDFYIRYCKPLDIEYAFFCYLGRHDGIDTWLRCSRDAVRGSFSAEDVDSIHDYLPHLDRAVRTYLRLEGQRSKARLYAQTAAALGVGMVLLDRQQSIVGSNEEAEAILAEGDAVMRVGNRLALAGTGRRYYSQILEKITADSSNTGQMMVAARDGERKVSLVVRRVEDITGYTANTEAAFVVYLHRGSQGLFPRAVAFVAEYFGLTQVEARLTVMLADGLALDEIAIRLGVTHTSARTYCKRVLAKTGTSRQVELVRQVLTSLARLS